MPATRHGETRTFSCLHLPFEQHDCAALRWRRARCRRTSQRAIATCSTVPDASRTLTAGKRTSPGGDDRVSPSRPCRLLRPSPPQLYTARWADVIWAHGKLGLCIHPAILACAASQLQAEDGRQVLRMKAKHLCRLAWGLAKAGYRGEALWQLIVAASSAHIASFTPHSLAVVIWATASIGVANHSLLGLTGSVLQQHSTRGACPALAIITWGLAKSEYREPALLQQLLGLILATDLCFTPRNICNILWALATNRCSTGPAQLLVQRLFERAGLLLSHFSSHGLCTVLWAAARLRCAQKSWSEALLREVEGRAQHLQALDLAQVAWACASLQVEAPRLLRTIQVHSLPHLPAMDACTLANLLWGLSSCRCYSAHLFSAAAQRLAALAPTQVQPRALVRAAASFRAVRHYNAALLDAIATCCIAQQQQLDARDLATLALVYADLQHHCPHLFAVLSPRASHALRSGRLDVRQAANLAWAYAVAQQPDGVLLELWAALRGCRDPRALPFRAAVQLMQAHMLLRGMYPQGVECVGRLPQPLSQACRAAWLKASAASQPSALTMAVLDVLKWMGIDATPECATKDGLFRLDIGLLHDGRRVALEVDGPHHFTCNIPHRPLGRSVARQRCLELRGVQVVSIPFFEWTKLSCMEQRACYLTAALDGSRWRTVVPGTAEGKSGSSIAKE